MYPLCRTTKFLKLWPLKHLSHCTAPPTELFYLVKVQKKRLAEENKSDIFGHIVQKGELYLEGVYLEKLEKETSDKVFYKLHSKIVYVHPEEILCPAVPIISS